MEKVESQGHVENFVQLIRHLHPECNSSIRMAKELAMTQFSFTATCQQVKLRHFHLFAGRVVVYGSGITSRIGAMSHVDWKFAVV